MRVVVLRTMSTSTSACARSRCSSSSAAERSGAPSFTAARSRSTERSGWRRAVMTRRCVTLIHSVEMSLGSNEKSKWTSLMTAISDCSVRSRRVECSPSSTTAKNSSDSAACAASHGRAPVWARLKCSHRKLPSSPPCGAASQATAVAESMDCVSTLGAIR